MQSLKKNKLDLKLQQFDFFKHDTNITSTNFWYLNGEDCNKAGKLWPNAMFVKDNLFAIPFFLPSHCVSSLLW